MVVVFGPGANLPHGFSSVPARRAAVESNQRTEVDYAGSDKNSEATKTTAPDQEDEQAFRNALLDSDPDVRTVALDKLAERPGSETVDTLLSAARSNDPTLRRHGLELLSQSAEADHATVLLVLGDAAKDKDPEVQAVAVQALVSQGGPDAIELLRQAFGAADPSVKALMLENLGSTPAAIPLLQQASSDSDESIRRSASVLLQEATQQGN
jgi:HEAT repeat protein